MVKSLYEMGGTFGCYDHKELCHVLFTDIFHDKNVFPMSFVGAFLSVLFRFTSI